MTTIITQGDIVIHPDVVDGYQASSESNTKVHKILGRSNPDITERPADLRKGTLRLVFGGAGSGGVVYVIVDGIVVGVGTSIGDAEARSAEAETVHNSGGVFSLQSDERTTIVMDYIVPEGSSARRELDGATRDVWIVSVDFQEVIQ